MFQQGNSKLIQVEDFSNKDSKDGDSKEVTSKVASEIDGDKVTTSTSK